MSDIPGSSESSDHVDDTELKKLLQQADELKQEGNEHFRAKNWDGALVAYRSALGQLPKRSPPTTRSSDPKGKGKETEAPEESDEEAGDNTATKATEVSEPLRALSEAEQECAKVRSILNANIGACYVKLGDHKEAVTSCSEALQDDPTYVKALQRRAASSEQLNTWSSLSSAQEDYSTLLTLLPSTSSQVPEIQRNIVQLKPRIEAAQKRETDEMLGKLKGLGDNILGKFGFSTDNFKFEPNGQGGYSMNFVR